MITKQQRGFTLIEILVAMVLLTIISLVLVSSLTPWLNFKQKLDTERKLTDLKTAISLAYAANAMGAENSTNQEIRLASGTISPSTQEGTQCVSPMEGWRALASFLPEGPQTAQLDGYAAPWCVFITPQLSTMVDGVPLYYHNIAIVSMGREGRLDSETKLDLSTGALTLGGDNLGILINGYEIQMDKLQKTQDKMERIATLYGIYFTTQYLATPSRDIALDYFANGNPSGSWNTSGTVPGSANQTVNAKASTLLQSIGVGPQDAVSAYELQNDIYVANASECVAGTCARSTENGGTPPFTALLYTSLPGPAGNQLVKVVTGNY